MKLIERFFAKLRRDGFVATMITVAYVLRMFKHRMARKQILKLDTLQQRFSEIYAKNSWSSKESGSGEGSEIEYTERLRSWLINAIPKYGVNRFVDVPCGDFNWMKLVVPKLDIEYFGFDIVDSVIEKNKEQYESKKAHFDVESL